MEPAVKELTEKDNWIIKWNPLKKGRKIVRIQFWFQKNDQFRMDI
ncbi:RepB family plasmid replication initiator protein [Providencia sp. PROV157]|nr:RepB family plasmid replication initiator protein [Providencia sp. PROV157]